MERPTEDIMCALIVFFVGLAFVLDLFGLAWAMIRKKTYKSMIGSFIEGFLNYPSLFWLPVLISIMYIYFFTVVHPY